MPSRREDRRTWSTREPIAPDFARDWQACIERSPHANFSMTLPFLEWEAKHGRHARAVLVSGGAAGAIVLREAGGEFHSGWPWRWQAVVADPARSGPVGLTAGEALTLFEHASAVAAPGRLRCFLPVTAPDGVPGYRAAGTLIQSLAVDDQAMLMAMEPTKRRATRRAAEKGCTVVEATTPELYRGFAELQVETKRRHGDDPPPVAAAPDMGEDWREWELPWMWLLVAVREGRVISGFGLGLAAGGMLEGRTSATGAEGRKIGAFSLLVHEASKRARDRGYRWHNNGGDTFFKRDMLGDLATPVSIHCWLGGGLLWAIGNQGEALGQRLLPRARKLRQRLRDLTARKRA